MKQSLPWIVFILLFTSLIGYFLYVAKIQLGGDIVEYYGASESMLNHGGVSLESSDQASLEKVMHAAYFSDPGYYVTGRDADRYPVHFVFYSSLVAAARIVLQALQSEELRSLWIVNIFSLGTAIWFIWRRYVHSAGERLLVLLLALISPLATFIFWPGPDLWYLSWLLIAAFAAGKKEWLLSSLLVALASWHSQPLLVLSGLFFSLYFFKETTIKNKNLQLNISLQEVVASSVLLGIVSIPYLYNLYAFNQLTPWRSLQDGWTQLYGFGMHNMSLWKLYEQFFDLNIGQFWYAPLLFLCGMVGLLRKGITHRIWLFVPVFLTITAFFYQTNPAWHYGTAGYGPGRHALFIVPFMIYGAYYFLKSISHRLMIVFTTLIILVNAFLLSLNGGLEPQLVNTLHHNQLATWVLTYHPSWYSPTPEIFVDRTNHTDITRPTSAILKTRDGVCRKAYILDHERSLLESECGVSALMKLPISTDDFQLIANYERSLTTFEATLWPQSDSCAEWFVKTTETPFDCAKTKEQAMLLFAINDPDRLTQLPDYPYPGIWKVKQGDPLSVRIPPGYIVDYYSPKGRYASF